MPDIGDYTAAELREMSREDFEAAQAREFAKPGGPAAESHILFAAPAAGPDVRPTEIRVGSSVPQRPVVEPRPAADANAWASNKKSNTYRFTAPSGQTCRIRRLSPERMLEAGILDKITVLEALAEKLVDKAEGNPPAKRTVPTREEFAMLLETINILVPIAVVEPTIWAEGDEAAPEDAIYVSDIDLDDRMAIMAESIKGISALASFRNPG